jgi:hypothetical protein
LQTLGRARNLPPRLEFLLTTLSSGPCCVQQPLDASTSQWWSNLSRFLPYGGLESLTSSRSLGARSLASWPFGFCSRTPAFLAFASLGGSQKKGEVFFVTSPTFHAKHCWFQSQLFSVLLGSF